MRTRRLALAALLLAPLLGCSPLGVEQQPSQGPESMASGFLTDYADLERGDKSGATFVLRDRDVAVSGYDRILLDHVTLWRDSERGFEAIPDTDLDHLAARLFTDLSEALDEDYEMVGEPGPGVMRVAVAITDVRHAGAPMDTYAADVDARDRTPRASTALGAPVREFLANASLELELTDSRSGKVLAAALDRRLAERVQDGRFDDWADVEWGFDAWARLLATRLRQSRAGAGTD